MPPVIALLTDFGTDDAFAGIMKAVITRINPRAQVIDITHSIPAHDTLKAALVLKSAYRYFPGGTVFAAVVDPGVGSKRNAVILKTDDYVFVAPDNGVLSLIARQEKNIRIYRISCDRYFLKPVSSTFQGRDIFAPVAARLSRGTAPRQFGPKLRKLEEINLPAPRIDRRKRQILGEVIYTDHFGNLMTNIEEHDLRRFSGQTSIRIKNKTLRGVESSYAHVPMGQFLAVINSAGYLEIAVNRGSAHKALKSGRGEALRIRFV